MSRDLYYKMNKFTIERIKKIKGFKTNKQVAELFGLSDSDFINRKNRNTLIPLIVDWAIKENVDLNRLLKEHTQDLGVWVGVKYAEDDSRNPKIKAAEDNLYNIDTSDQSAESNPSTLSTASDPDKKNDDLLELLAMTREVLISDTDCADSLKANIRSFHKSVKLQKQDADKYDNILKELHELKKQVNETNSQGRVNAEEGQNTQKKAM